MTTQKKSEKLTAMQKKFCIAFASGKLSGAEAIKKAGSKANGNSRATTASKWLRLPKIKSEISRQKTIQKKDKKKTGQVHDPSLPLDNPKHEAFVQGLLRQENRLNYTDAYLEAGFRSKSRASARKAASRLLTSVDILNRLEWMKEQVADDTITTAKERRQILSRIERGKWGDVLSEDGSIDIAAVRKAGPELKKVKVLQQVNVPVGEAEIPAQIMAIEMRDPTPAIRVHNTMDGSNPPGELRLSGNLGMTNMPPEPESIEEWERQVAAAKRASEELEE